MNKQEYVVGFMFDSTFSSVVLVEKQRPTWQKGKLNGVGGHIEEGETPEAAMTREFHEETSVLTTQWTRFCDHVGPDFVVHYFYGVSDPAHDNARTVTDEDIGQYVIKFLNESRLMTNLPWLLQAAAYFHFLPDYEAQHSGEHFDRKTDLYTVLELNRHQPPPVQNTGTPVWDLVIADMRARDFVGRERYGTPLQAFNGRDALVDAYQESLDLTAYLRQAIEERNMSGFLKGSTGLNLPALNPETIERN